MLNNFRHLDCIPANDKLRKSVTKNFTFYLLENKGNLASQGRAFEEAERKIYLGAINIWFERAHLMLFGREKEVAGLVHGSFG
jgi:hypothetical protein